MTSQMDNWRSENHRWAVVLAERILEADGGQVGSGYWRMKGHQLIATSLYINGQVTEVFFNERFGMFDL